MVSQYGQVQSVTGLFVNAYRDLVLNNNGLMIFASGNGKQTQPGQLSRLPSLPTVEGGIACRPGKGMVSGRCTG